MKKNNSDSIMQVKCYFLKAFLCIAAFALLQNITEIVFFYLSWNKWFCHSGKKNDEFIKYPVFKNMISMLA